MSLTPDDPTIWSAVLFVREGPYAPAVMRFHINFPDAYPQLPPLVTFSTDMFHPLITPLTTYMYTTDIQENGTVSATDEERLPPGGFSLRHGFPDWFGRGKWTAGSSTSSKAPETLGHSAYKGRNSSRTSAYDVLKYIRSAFDSEEALDSVPLDAAGNPGAWNAWRTHRRKQGKLVGDKMALEEAESQDSEPPPVPEKNTPPKAVVRRPGQWNWDGVWEDRVKKGIASSLSESVLYGGASSANHEELVSLSSCYYHTINLLSVVADQISTHGRWRCRLRQGKHSPHARESDIAETNICPILVLIPSCLIAAHYLDIASLTRVAITRLPTLCPHVLFIGLLISKSILDTH